VIEDVEGKVAVVTGGASGIGLGMARAFADAGMRVVLADVDDERLEAAARAIADRGAEVLALRTDVSDAAAVDALASATVDRFGAVHLLCNNAGVFTIGYQWETSLEDWTWVVGVNLMGVVHGVRAFVPRMLAGGEPAHVVNTASMAGLMTAPLSGSYNATKHAVVGLSKNLRAELRIARSAIGVSVVCPGEVSTNIVENLRARYAGEDPPAVVQAAMDRLTSRLEVGMSIEDAGRTVLDAVRTGRFWVLLNAAPHLDAYRAELAELLGPGTA
jgi:NAD(P)-dependent dehydrogenase (short-subunit alcohol dehydrogenase family)